MEPRDVVVIGGSAGALASLCELAAAPEETAALAGHLVMHAADSEDLADQPKGTAEWAAGLAETVRAQMRKAQG